jgi:hypothetical protein
MMELEQEKEDRGDFADWEISDMSHPWEVRETGFRKSNMRRVSPRILDFSAGYLTVNPRPPRSDC